LLLCSIRSILNHFAAIHKVRISHNDIKAGNVLVTIQGSVVVIDFGGSRGMKDHFGPRWPGEAQREVSFKISEQRWTQRPGWYLDQVTPRTYSEDASPAQARSGTSGAGPQAQRFLKSVQQVEIKSVELAMKRKEQDTKHWDDVDAGLERGSDKGLCGHLGTQCGRSPEVVVANHEMKQCSSAEQKKIKSQMMDATFAEGGDLYSIGLLFVHWITGLSPLDLANKRLETIAGSRERAPGPDSIRREASGGVSNDFAGDKRLRCWVQEEIHGGRTPVELGNFLRSFQGEPLPPARDRHPVALLWTAYAKVLRGLLATEQTQRCTAVQALAMLQGLNHLKQAKRCDAAQDLRKVQGLCKKTRRPQIGKKSS
jgi:serine/threonine protein kinase